MGPINVGPVQPAKAYVPPGTTNFATSGAVQCAAPLQPPCVDPLVSVIKVVADTAKATSASSPTTDCAPGVQLPSTAAGDFTTGRLTGGNACSNISHVSGLNIGTPTIPVYNLDVDGVTAQSITQGCTIQPKGVVSIASLKAFGATIVGPGGIDAGGIIAPTNQTITIPGVAHIILNEQHFDSQGHGLSVNAVHVFLYSTLGSLTGADIVIGHAHSEANCPDGTTTDTGKLPGPVTPIVTKLDSTKHANPGETVSYKVTIDNKGCTITHIIDTLPPFFTYVPGSAKGPLGPPAVSIEQGSNQQQLEWYDATGVAGGANPIVETFSAKIDPLAPEGQYINNVDGFSDCGEFNGEDLIALTSGPPDNQGPNPGIIVPRPTVASQPPPRLPLPDTSTGMPISGSSPAGTPWPLIAAIVALAIRLGFVRSSRNRRRAGSIA